MHIRPVLHPVAEPRAATRAVAGAAADVPVMAVGSHDTASAVVGVPAATQRFAYISCGTWSLVGVELDAPVLSDASRRANFTNELGVDGTVRYLRNVMGLWLLQESMRWGTVRPGGSAGRRRPGGTVPFARRSRRPGLPAAGGHAGAHRRGV